MIAGRFIKEAISNLIFTYRKFIAPGLANEKGFRILMYHSIQPANPKTDRMGLGVGPELFRMHMKYLRDNDFYVANLSDMVSRLATGAPIPPRAVAITFDDGYRSVLTNASPILKEFGYPATLFINIYFVEKRIPPGFYWHDWEALDWDGVKALDRAGVSIGSHAVSHRKLTELNDEELKDEIAGSKKMIEGNIESGLNAFSYPHGAFNDKAIKVLKDSGYLYSCSSIEGANDAQGNVYALKRTEITAFDDTVIKFEKKMSGSYDWLGYVRSHS